MWIALAFVSAFCLGFYDIFKKLSVRDNNVPVVLMLNTLFGTLLMSPVFVTAFTTGHWGLAGEVQGHLFVILKAVIVLSSWILGYFAIKHLPLTIQGPINATRPVMVLLGAILIYGERLNWLQWAGMLLGFASLFFISRLGSREGFSFRRSAWLWMSIGATVLGAVSALYDKFLMRHYTATDVQAWYSLYQFVLMSVIVVLLRRLAPSHSGGRFSWKWSIPCISLFLTAADLAYFYCLSLSGAMISVVSMIRRGSVIIPFVYGIVVLHERNIRRKAINLAVLLVSLLLLVLGSCL